MMFDKFTTVTVKGPGGVTTEWPARIPASNRFVLRIQIQRRKRTRENHLLLVRETLEDAATSTIIDELLNSSRTEVELTALHDHGLVMMQRAHRSWALVGTFSAAAPTLPLCTSGHGRVLPHRRRVYHVDFP